MIPYPVVACSKNHPPGNFSNIIDAAREVY
jgi:hypothetical protein